MRMSRTHGLRSQRQSRTHAHLAACVRAAEVHPALQEFAEARVGDLGDDAGRSRVQEVSDQLQKQLGALSGVRNVVVSGQALADSSGFRAPPTLVQSSTAVYGLAVKRVAGEAGRFMLVVLARSVSAESSGLSELCGA